MSKDQQTRGNMGLPARQYGEEIVKPGDGFGPETLGQIKSIAEDGAQVILTRPSPDSAVSQPLVKSFAARLTDGEQTPAPEKTASDLPLVFVSRRPVPTVPFPIKTEAQAPCADVDLMELDQDEDEVTNIFADIAFDDEEPDLIPSRAPVVPRRPTKSSEYVDPLLREILDEGEGPIHVPQFRALPRYHVEEDSELESLGTIRRAIRILWTTPRYLALVVLTTVVFWRPLFIPALVLVVFLAGLLALIAIGPERLTSLRRVAVKAFMRRHPRFATAMARWMGRGRSAMIGASAHLPEPVSDGIYARLQGSDDDIDRVAARLDRVARQESGVRVMPRRPSLT